MTNTLRTWGQALDYTMQHRWKRLASAKTNEINSRKITDLYGRSLPVARMAKAGFWIEMITELQDLRPVISGNTINKVISTGTTVLSLTNRAGLHDHQVPDLRDIRMKKVNQRHTWYTKEQVDQMVHVATDIFSREDLADAILFSAYTGVRQGELLKLHSEDVDLAHNTLWVGGKPNRINKGNDIRTVQIHEKLTPVINRRLDRKFLFKEDWSNKDQLYRAFKKVRDYAGISDDHCWHTLRHSFGTWLGEVTHPKQIQALMGHADIQPSLKYCHATDEATRSAILAI